MDASFMFGCLTATAIIGIGILVTWAIKHTQFVSQMKKDISNMQDSMENAHRYFDNKTENIHAKIDNEVSNLGRSLESHVEDLHQKIDNRITTVLNEATRTGANN